MSHGQEQEPLGSGVPTDELLAAFAARVMQRARPYAVQVADGTYRWCYEDVTPALLLAHVRGEMTLALSSADAWGQTRWLCLDVDDPAPDALAHLLAVRQALAEVGLPGLVEASRRGGHLWLFLDVPVPVATTRAALLVALDQLHSRGIALPAYELYPDQAAQTPGALGHAVRIPLGVHQLTGKRYPLFDADGHPCAFTFDAAAVQYVCNWPGVPASVLRDLANLAARGGDAAEELVSSRSSKSSSASLGAGRVASQTEQMGKTDKSDKTGKVGTRLEERRLIVRRGRAWHLRRGWYGTLTLLRVTAVPTPPLTVAERPGPTLPTFADLEQWDQVCRWLDEQPGQRARLPIVDVPQVGAVSADMLQGMRRYRLVRHAADCTWRLAASWKPRLYALWQGVTKTEGERQPTVSDAPAPYSVAAGIDTWYLNRIDAAGLPPALRMALDDLQAQAKDEDDEVETSWAYDGVPLLMYRAGVSTTQGRGVSWTYILRNPSLTLLLRKAPLGGIIAQARLGSECLWRRTPLAALNDLDALVRRLWRTGLRRGRESGQAGQGGHWQVSQVHLAHDVAHAPLAVEQLECYVSRSRKQSIFGAARADLQTLYAGLDIGLPADGMDTFAANVFDWDALYAPGDEDLFDGFDLFTPDNGRSAPAEPVPVEDRSVRVHRWARRLSGITWSPGAAVSFVAYDKVLEGRLRGKSHMEAIWRANGWDGTAPVTRHEARLRRDALRTLGIAESQLAEFDDPWMMLEHLQDLFGYVVGRPTATTAATDCPQVVDIAWLRRVVPDPDETNRSRWPTDPVWAVVQAPQFTAAPAEVRRLIRREVRSQRIEQRDRGGYGLLVSRTALAYADPRFWNLEYAMGRWYQAFEDETEKPGKAFHELVRQRRRMLGLPVLPEAQVLPRRSLPSASLPAIDIAIDYDADDDQGGDGDGNERGKLTAAPVAWKLELLRTERRLEELEIAQDAAVQAHAPRKRIDELDQAYQRELQVYDAIRRQMGAEETE